jgi:hypothetical protein
VAWVVISREVQRFIAETGGFYGAAVFFIGGLRDLAGVVNDLLAGVAPRFAADG